MIEAAAFIERARQRGYTWYTGVPCSFLTPFINHVIGDAGLRYLSAANEGDAVATAAGIALGGGRAVAMMQNSGLGNAVSPLTSLTWTFRLPMLIVCTHRGAPGVHDEPQHALMGRITGALFDTMGVPWRGFPADEAAIDAALDAAQASLDAERRPYALLMQQGTVRAAALQPRRIEPRAQRARPAPAAFARPLAERAAREQALRSILALTRPERHVLIATTGYTGRELYALADRPNHFYMVGSMGCASSLGLGLALQRPDRAIVILDGDGAALMRMGNFASVGAYGGDNLTHIVLDNEVHDSTGGQLTVSPNVDFAALAAACGYASVAASDELSAVERLLCEPSPGPRLLHLKIRPGTRADLPRPAIAPHEVAARLMQHLRES